MAYVALGISVFIAALGALGVASPARLFSVLRRNETPAALYVWAAVRLVLGVALFLVAPRSRAPDLIRIVGVIAVAAGVITPVLGLARIGRVIDWWSAQRTIVLRVWAAFGLALGLFLVWAVVPLVSC
jgi:hypothetical protein